MCVCVQCSASHSYKSTQTPPPASLTNLEGVSDEQASGALMHVLLLSAVLPSATTLTL